MTYRRTAGAVALATILLLVQGVGPAASQDAGSPHEIPGWDRPMIDISPVMALIGFYGFRTTLPVSDRGRFIAGYMYQNFKNDLGRSHSHALLIGYQHYIWRGLEVELELWPGYNNWHSSIDDEWYPGPELWAEARVGYRLDLETAGIDWYLLPQLLAGKGLWDGFDAPGDFSEPFFFPAIWAGMPIR